MLKDMTLEDALNEYEGNFLTNDEEYCYELLNNSEVV